MRASIRLAVGFCFLHLFSGDVFAGSIKSYANHLERCQPYTMSYNNPFADEPMTREVKGMRNGKCRTEETVPGDEVLVCEFTESARKEAVAAYRKGGGQALANVMNGPSCKTIAR